MSSFIETTQQVTTQIHDLNNKILSQLKTYSFFIFYQLSSVERKKISILQKINFSLTHEKSNSYDSTVAISQKTKQIQIHFYDIQNHSNILHSISDIRNHSFQSINQKINVIDKAKIIINASQEKLGFLLEEFQKMKVDLSSIPIMLNSNQFQSDISAFLGWKNQKKQCMAFQSLQFYHTSSEQWIKAATQKIDVWQAQISVSKQKGQIYKLINNKLTLLPKTQKSFKQFFISHLCIGYHASLLLNCKSKITTNQDTVGNNVISMFERFKKFCCVGDRSMKSTTGIANITLVDEKGEQLEILKQLRQGDSSQEESQADFKAAKYKQYKDILSILLTNVNIYQGEMLDKSIEGKIYDGKLQLLTFQSQKNHRKICSSPGQVRIKMEAESVDLQVGQSLYRLMHPQQIRISFSKKIKIGINNKLLRC